jgi:isopenicillin N synthase-like dioxygenase
LQLLWRQKFDAGHANVYRGWFPLQEGHQTYKEGIDIGPDIAYGAAIVDNSDPLREATPLPPEAALPGWRAAASAYYRAMELTGRMLMRAIARGLGSTSRLSIQPSRAASRPCGWRIIRCGRRRL